MNPESWRLHLVHMLYVTRLTFLGIPFFSRETHVVFHTAELSKFALKATLFCWVSARLWFIHRHQAGGWVSQLVAALLIFSTAAWPRMWYCFYTTLLSTKIQHGVSDISDTIWPNVLFPVRAASRGSSRSHVHSIARRLPAVAQAALYFPSEGASAETGAPPSVSASSEEASNRKADVHSERHHLSRPLMMPLNATIVMFLNEEFCMPNAEEWRE